MSLTNICSKSVMDMLVLSHRENPKPERLKHADVVKLVISGQDFCLTSKDCQYGVPRRDSEERQFTPSGGGDGGDKKSPPGQASCELT